MSNEGCATAAASTAAAAPSCPRYSGCKQARRLRAATAPKGSATPDRGHGRIADELGVVLNLLAWPARVARPLSIVFRQNAV